MNAILMGQLSEEKNVTDKNQFLKKKASYVETDFVKIDRGVVYVTERHRRQVFVECLFWVVFYSVQFYLSRQLTQENHGIVESKEKRELCMHLLDSATDYIKIMRHV